MLQLGLLLAACKRAGIVLKLRKPQLTPGVRQFVRVVIPATLGAGVYQVSVFIDTFFLTRIGTGAVSWFNYADRLNQLPLGVIGAAIGTAILPQVSRHVDIGEADKAARVQGQAAELAMLLCLPAALALAVSALPLVSAIFEAGRFNASDAHFTALTLSIIALGLPAYVLVKVLTPGFYARRDTATPVKIAIVVLVVNVILNFALIPPFGIGGLAAAVALSSWLNCAILYVLLHRRGHFRIEKWLASRICAAADRRRGDGRRVDRHPDRARRLVRRLVRPSPGRGGGASSAAGWSSISRWCGCWAAPTSEELKMPVEAQEALHRCRLNRSDARRLRNPADRRPAPRQSARRDPALGADAGRGGMPVLPRRPPRADRRRRAATSCARTSAKWRRR